LAQSTVYYNIKEIEEDENLHLSFDEVSNEYCVQRLNGDAETLMAVVQINLPTGHTANKYSMQSALENNDHSGVLRFDDNTDNLSVYLNKIDHEKRCFSITLDKSEVEIENPQKRSVVVYDYYNTSVRRSIMI
jgi:hypothetical protein